MLKQGNKRPLENDDLPPLLKEDQNEALVEHLQKEWILICDESKPGESKGWIKTAKLWGAFLLKNCAGFRDSSGGESGGVTRHTAYHAAVISYWTAFRTYGRVPGSQEVDLFSRCWRMPVRLAHRNFQVSL